MSNPTKQTSERYLEYHSGSYRVTMGVPNKLQKILGVRRFRYSLETASLAIAKKKKATVVAEFKKKIADGWTELDGQPLSDLDQALRFAEDWKTAREEPGWWIDELRDQIMAYSAKILTKDSKWRFVPLEDPDAEEDVLVEETFYAEGAEDRSKIFEDIAFGRATPVYLHHETFLKTLPIADRSKDDDRRALKIFMNWCNAEKRNTSLEKISRKTAATFKNNIRQFTGLEYATCRKYLGRLRMYWDFLLELEEVEKNVWENLSLRKPHEYKEFKERDFTDAEVRALLMGTNDPAMLDPMLIGALTGARLDAVIDLRVAECADGWFTFKPQKREEGQRDVPIHPALRELVARRTADKSPEDHFSPEWPEAENPSGKRSASYSKRFTRYRRSRGIADELDGKRRSLVNFHSFRRWFITKGERTGTTGDMIAAIVGHQRSGITLNRYSSGPEVKAARKAVARIKLPPLDDSPLKNVRPLIRRPRA